jgi:hypothetical protein
VQVIAPGYVPGFGLEGDAEQLAEPVTPAVLAFSPLANPDSV